MPDRNGLEPCAVAFSSDRNDKLTLLFIVLKGGRDFHSVRWEHDNNGEWIRQLEITQAQFQDRFDRPRWISDLHSFEPAIGHAIVKVAEEEEEKVMDGIRCTRVIYSWRVWDLLSNVEIAFIKRCDSPFEWLEPTVTDG